MVYFRPRSRPLRPYLAVGPAWAQILSDNKPDFAPPQVIVVSRSGWGFRYTFGEMMTANPFAQTLSPPASRRLVNFQNPFGIVKRF